MLSQAWELCIAQCASHFFLVHISISADLFKSFPWGLYQTSLPHDAGLKCSLLIISVPEYIFIVIFLWFERFNFMLPHKLLLILIFHHLVFKGQDFLFLHVRFMCFHHHSWYVPHPLLPLAV